MRSCVFFNIAGDASMAALKNKLRFFSSTTQGEETLSTGVSSVTL